jgi:hypothetical protein
MTIRITTRSPEKENRVLGGALDEGVYDGTTIDLGTGQSYEDVVRVDKRGFVAPRQAGDVVLILKKRKRSG